MMPRVAGVQGGTENPTGKSRKGAGRQGEKSEWQGGGGIVVRPWGGDQAERRSLGFLF